MTHLLLVIIYLSFISLGLPDSVLGAAWPAMRQDLDVPLSYAGIVSMIIGCGTVFSSLQSERLMYHFNAGKITAFSVALTALAIYGFSISDSFWMICLWAIPYGLGAGAVDTVLNNYVAVNYASRHMSWLHCMWGVGASMGPYILAYALLHGDRWDTGYFYIALIQITLSAILFCSLPLWKRQQAQADNSPSKPLKLQEVLQIPNVRLILLAFFCYCGVEQTAGLWASSYLVLDKGIEKELAASYASLFFIGITIGRGVSGFLTMKLNDKQMIQLGFSLILLGIILFGLPLNNLVALIGLMLIGLGCAPIYPCLIHSTPHFFGEERSQAVIGVEMATSYISIVMLPPFFGVLANAISISLLPLYLLLSLAGMARAYHKLLQGHQT